MSDIRSMQELLPWLAPLTDGLVVCKDSSFLATYEFFGPDADTMGETEASVVGAATERMLVAMRDLPLTFWWTVRRERTTDYPGVPMPDPISQMLDDEHKNSFLNGSAYINRHFLSVLWMPEKGTASFIGKLGKMMGEGAGPVNALKTAVGSTFLGRKSFAWRTEELDVAVEEFEGRLSQIESILASLSPVRLTGQAMMGFLWAMTNPGKKMVDKAWNGNTLLDAGLSESALTVHRDVLQFDDSDPVYVSGISMKQWPSDLGFGAFNPLTTLPIELVISHCFRCLSRSETDSEIKKNTRFNDIFKYKLGGWITLVASRGEKMPKEEQTNISRVRALEQARELEGILDEGHLVFGWHNLTVTLVERDADKLNEITRMCLRMFNSSRLTGVVHESVGLLSAWCTTLPGQWQEGKRWLMLSSENQAYIAPLLGVHQGERMNDHLTAMMGTPCQALTVLGTDMNTPFYFNFHSGALGHTMVVGPTRSGKSIAMNFLISQFRKYGDAAEVIIFDKDYSCKIATLLQGGEHLDLREGSAIRLNPMLLIRERKHWGFLVRWIEGLIESRGYHVTSEDNKAIFEAIEDIANDSAHEVCRLLSVSALLPIHLKVHLDQWVGNGQYGDYFDNLEDAFNLSNFSCIEMGKIMSEPRIARAFMDYAFYRIQQKLEGQIYAQKIGVTMIYVEECWFLLGDEYFAGKVKDWLKTFAKLNAFVVLATQSIEDFAALSPTVFASIRDGVQTQIFLPSAKANTEEMFAIYRKYFDLRPDLIQRIATAIPKQEYIIVKPDVARKVRMQLTSRQVSVLRSEISMQRIFETVDRTRPGWQWEYLNLVDKTKPKQQEAIA